MNRISSVIKMHSKDKWSWFIIPWLVMLSSFFINFAISAFVDTPIYTGGVSSIYIYMFVAGIITLAQTFPFALGIGVSRTDYYIGTSTMVLLTSIGSALVLFLLSLTEVWTGSWGTGLHFFHLPYYSDGPLINQFLVPLVILLLMHFTGVLISALYRRTGKNGLFLISGILLIAFTVLGFLITYLNWFDPIYKWIVRQTAVDYTLWMLPFIVVFASASYLLLRKATV
ncbi:hypothetical protein [Paenibacillus dakarensis]|uniref:hypothetical protein n=1 Tax=Paenibacillus dakarensis TaxID=1527293 RepID=UPI0006D5AD15|nr:hypothetical protein [Paenibacillus dakarensis]